MFGFRPFIKLQQKLRTLGHDLGWFVASIESRFGPKRGFGDTPGELLTISKPNHYPRFVNPQGGKGAQNQICEIPSVDSTG